MVDQLYGKMFLDYFVVMIRAQWDKLVSLGCFVFGLDTNWKSVSDGIESLKSVCKRIEWLSSGMQGLSESFPRYCN